MFLLLMAEILHHLGCMKPYKLVSRISAINSSYQQDRLTSSTNLINSPNKNAQAIPLSIKIKGQLGVPLTRYPWYLLCSLGILGDYIGISHDGVRWDRGASLPTPEKRLNISRYVKSSLQKNKETYLPTKQEQCAGMRTNCSLDTRKKWLEQKQRRILYADRSCCILNIWI